MEVSSFLKVEAFPGWAPSVEAWVNCCLEEQSGKSVEFCWVLHYQKLWTRIQIKKQHQKAENHFQLPAFRCSWWAEQSLEWRAQPAVCLSVFFLRGSKQDCRCVAPEWAVRASLGWAPSFPSTVSSAPVSRELSPGSTPVAWLSEKITSWQVLTPYLYLVKVFIMFPADTDGEERVVLLLACLSDKSQWLFTNSWVAVGYQYIPFCFFTASPVPAGRQVSSVQRFLRSWLAYLLFIFITLILIFFLNSSSAP